MGFLSKLWKGVKNVFSGILKIFSPILKPLGKILGSKWGKVLMLALSVFTFGASLMAGAGTFGSTLAGGGSFLEAFVAGGKEFVSTLLGTGAKEGAGGAGEAALVEGAVQTAVDPLATNILSGAGAEVANIGGGALPGASTQMAQSAGQVGGTLGAGGMGGMPNFSVPTGVTGAQEAAGIGTRLTTAASTTATAAKVKPKGNWLTKAAGKAWDFAKSEPGQQLIGDALQGYSQGKRDEALFEHESRYDRMWQDPNQTQPIQDLTSGFGPNVPSRWNRDPAELVNRRISTYKPSVDFRRIPQGAGG